jgi:hypothetical protein
VLSRAARVAHASVPPRAGAAPHRGALPLALDGTTVRGAAVGQPAGPRQAPQRRAVSGPPSQEPLIQVPVDGTTTELPVAHALRPALPRRGRRITAAALHPPTAVAQTVLAQGGDSLRWGTGTPPTRSDARALACADPDTSGSPPTSTTDRHRGRPAGRRSRTTTARHDSRTVLPNVGQVAAWPRTVPDRTGDHHAIVFRSTSRPPARATHQDRRRGHRGLWPSAARHGVRAVPCGADRARRRGGHAPQCMAAVRTRCRTRIRRTGTTPSAAKRRSFANHPANALALLLPKPRSA